MNIEINDDRKIFAIQREFNTVFPYLKLEFQAKPNKVHGAPAHDLVKHSRTLGECRTIHKHGNVTITPFMKVSELEEVFRDVYGLGVKVYRKSGKAWLEVTVSGSWTLEEQNAQGENLSKIVL